MFNSKLKLSGYTLEEIIHEGIHGNVSEMSVDDWEYIESMFNEDILLEKAYDEGYKACLNTEIPYELEPEKLDSTSLPMQPAGGISLIQDDWTKDDSSVPEILEVILADDMDIHIRTNSTVAGYLRFRSMIGGGRYPNTHFALRSLYDAMKEDEKGNKPEAWNSAANRYMKDK